MPSLTVVVNRTLDLDTKHKEIFLNHSPKVHITTEFYANVVYVCTVKLGNKERFDKEQIGIKELFMDYQPFYTINLLLDKELLPI